jgi:hypothetical protein
MTNSVNSHGKNDHVDRRDYALFLEQASLARKGAENKAEIQTSNRARMEALLMD